MSIIRSAIIRLFSVSLIALAVLVTFIHFHGIRNQIQGGIVLHKRGGMSLRASEPFWFWLDITLQFAIGLLFIVPLSIAGYLGFRRRR